MTYLMRSGALEIATARAREIAPVIPLSARQAEILQCVASGMTDREIASALAISVKTVKAHLTNIYLVLNLPKRNQPEHGNPRMLAALYAIRAGIARL